MKIKKFNSKREHHCARGPPPPEVGTFLHEAVDDDAVAVDRGVLVVQWVDERLAQVKQALYFVWLSCISEGNVFSGGGNYVSRQNMRDGKETEGQSRRSVILGVLVYTAYHNMF